MLATALRVKDYEEKQIELMSFLNQTKWLSGDDIRAWIADCIVHFTEIGVPQILISHFLINVEYKKNRQPSGAIVDLIGPSGSHGPFAFHVGRGYKIIEKNRLTGKNSGGIKMTPVLVAFKVAENLIARYDNDIRLVPTTLINELDKYNETKSVALCFSAIQTSYEARDSKKMLAIIISATESLLNIIPELSDKKSIGAKIKKAYDTSAIYTKYSMSQEILWSLNNARIIRNIDTHKPNEDSDTTFFEVVSYTHLLVLLVLGCLVSGQLNLTAEIAAD